MNDIKTFYIKSYKILLVKFYHNILNLRKFIKGKIVKKIKTPKYIKNRSNQFIYYLYSSFISIINLRSYWASIIH